MSPLSSPALIVVDLQAVTLGNAKTLTPEVLLSNVATLIETFRKAGFPVVYAASTGTPAGRTSYAETGRAWTTQQAEIAPEVAPAGDDSVLYRAAWSAFAGTELTDILSQRNITTTVIVGMATPFGIESTARDAYDAGFSVIIPTDAIAAPDATAHEWTLTRVIPMLGTTTLVADLVNTIHPKD
jgi:nicotinamidase-related amidase